MKVSKQIGGGGRLGKMHRRRSVRGKAGRKERRRRSSGKGTKKKVHRSATGAIQTLRMAPPGSREGKRLASLSVGKGCTLGNPTPWSHLAQGRERAGQ